MSTDDLKRAYRIACTETDRLESLLARNQIKSTADWRRLQESRLRRDERRYEWLSQVMEESA